MLKVPHAQIWMTTPMAERWVLGRIQKFCSYPLGMISKQDERVAVRSYGTPERYLEFYPDEMMAYVVDYHGYDFGTGLFEEDPRREIIRKIKIKKVDGGLITLEHSVVL